MALDIGLLGLITYTLSSFNLQFIKEDTHKSEKVNLVATCLELLAALTSLYDKARQTLSEESSAFIGQVIDCIKSECKSI